MLRTCHAIVDIISMQPGHFCAGAPYRCTPEPRHNGVDGTVCQRRRDGHPSVGVLIPRHWRRFRRKARWLVASEACGQQTAMSRRRDSGDAGKSWIAGVADLRYAHLDSTADRLADSLTHDARPRSAVAPNDSMHHRSGNEEQTEKLVDTCLRRSRCGGEDGARAA